MFIHLIRKIHPLDWSEIIIYGSWLVVIFTAPWRAYANEANSVFDIAVGVMWRHTWSHIHNVYTVISGGFESRSLHPFSESPLSNNTVFYWGTEKGKVTESTVDRLVENIVFSIVSSRVFCVNGKCPCPAIFSTHDVNADHPHLASPRPCFVIQTTPGVIFWSVTHRIT